MDIYRNDVVVFSVEVDDSSVVSRSLMEEDKVILNFIVEAPLIFEIDDYVVFENEKYYLFGRPVISQKKENQISYVATFSGKIHWMENCVFTLSGQTSFYYTGTLTDMMNLIRVEGQRFFGPTLFNRQIFDNVVEINTIFFDNYNLLNALQLICDTYNVEFEIREGFGDTINVDIRTEINIGVNTALRFKEGLRNISIREGSRENLVTKLMVFGSERNVDATYGKRIRKANAATDSDSFVTWNTAEYGIKEGVEFFDEVYPRFTGIATSITNSGDTWLFTDNSIDFDINSYLLTEPAKITFTSGSLSGYEFVIVSYDHATKRIEFSVFTDDQDFTLPTALIKPSSGDSYVLHSIKMPSSYISTAENELSVIGLARVKQLARPRDEITCDIDPVWFRENDWELLIGQEIFFFAPELGITNQTQRVISLTKSVRNEYVYTAKFGYERNDFRLKSIEKLISENQKRIQEEEKRRLIEKFQNRGG